MDIQELRRQIDRIDAELIGLFCQRMNVASRIADYKKEHDLPINHPTREQEVLQKVAALSEPELAEYTIALYEKVFELSKDFQHRKNIR